MKNLRQNRHKSNRSNAYSGSKKSNWQDFDPYASELALIRADRNPTTTLEIADDVQIDVYERPVRESFVRPFSIDDLENALKTVPIRFLSGLNRILLFGGTKKQEQSARRLFRDGMYYPDERMIAIFPFLRRKMDYCCFRFSPHHFQEFRWAGAKIVQNGNEIYAQFDMENLKSYYLKIVLIHEIGHHVDWLRNKNDPKCKLTEEFADWFVGRFQNEFE